MAGQGLRSVVVKKYNHHANHGSIPDDKVNILKRDFGTETINQKWCTDWEWVRAMNSIVNRAEENIKRELIYA